jgi:hypothetical protein
MVLEQSQEKAGIILGLQFKIENAWLAFVENPVHQISFEHAAVDLNIALFVPQAPNKLGSWQQIGNDLIGFFSEQRFEGIVIGLWLWLIFQ